MKLFASLLIGIAFASSCAAYGLDDYKDIMLPDSPRAGADKKQLRVMFMGVATLLFDDGETAIMTDGYFSRPGRAAMQGKMEPNQERITKSLQRAGVKSLAAVIVVHSHFDHALDSPTVVRKTGALLVGSNSTANIGRGSGLPEEKIRVAANGQTMEFGRFKVTFLASAHLPIGFAMGDIKEPLLLPARASEYKAGDCYTLLIEHDGHTILVQGSAGFIPGALKGRKADVVYLGVGGMSAIVGTYKNDYWHELVQTVGARRVIPIHWDDFFVSNEEPLKPNSDFYSVMRFLQEQGKKENVDVRVPTAWAMSDPLIGL
ncbi:MAG TPA: MBL fold metallo-hydrolase [Burkholderiaceae bacterium]|jgi:L-ascorbate metabolism protein UlaG (beta-lactamase superfamily)